MILNNAIVGWTIAVGYCYVMEGCLRQTGFSFRENQSKTFPLLIVLVSSTLNTLSHTAVVVGTIKDAYTASILLGVGFDVLSTILYIIMWIALFCRAVTEATDTMNFLAVLLTTTCVVVTLLQWLTHIRALHLASSRERLHSIVRSASNNLKGVPGPGYSDHIFAFTDLGYHAFHTLAAVRLVGWRLGLAIFSALAAFVSVAFIIVNRSSSSESSPRGKPLLGEPLLTIRKDGKPVCSCHVCRGSAAFSVDWINGQLCAQWLQSFDQLCHRMDDLDKIKAT